jgi:hypothetical protein
VWKIYDTQSLESSNLDILCNLGVRVVEKNGD